MKSIFWGNGFVYFIWNSVGRRSSDGGRFLRKEVYIVRFNKLILVDSELKDVFLVYIL